ncbi:PTS system fructose-specific IIA component [Pantoea allii]|jgi:PTS system fructose-specific IIA component|uniref:PTS system fructose-specific IIA component n=1 Tax=Pantoea allii TaxID=574096 RepID=A0A2V2BP09_9GAMM|nr:MULTISPECIES: PTS sugar transporter subunit IIA [Pantoea]MBW1252120.1 PTS sugar transporter subunit IIA [Pantoea allii]MBW1261400.1 PTS sugar transporter subunit IIA [Pantoea allii]MBW1283941.1 PTS sugar transporter subunit IIA [Pantoea allii]MCH9299506.1 PTS sugar transporter subunit IIA [Pantoea allii]ORM83310.1 DNA-binding protein [Pantoea allii]
MHNKIVVADLLNQACVFMNLEAKNKDEVIEKLTASLCELNIISNKDGFIHDVMLREALGSTGFENQIAIPHGKSPWVNETRIAVAKLASPVEWETMDDSAVRLVILFAVKEADSGAGHIKLLAKISIALGDDDVVEALLNAETKEELFNLLVNNTQG